MKKSIRTLPALVLALVPLAAGCSASATADGDVDGPDAVELERVHPALCGTGCIKPPPSPPPPSADLVPVVSSGYCTNRAVTVATKNQGTAGAGASNMRITFSTSAGPAPYSFSIPTLAAGAASSTYTVPFPAGCYTPDCNFSVVVDVNGVVTEISESNNTFRGICIG